MSTDRKQGITSIGLSGRDGRDGRDMRAPCDLCIVVPHADTARHPEARIFIGQSWCVLVEQALADSP
jgi:D-sedoheptulose 7-phosphate isomerase